MENTRKHKSLEDSARESAIDALEKYASSIQNGTINTVIGEDPNNKTTEHEGNNTNGKTNANEKTESSSSC